MQQDVQPPEEILRRLFAAAVDSALPSTCVPPHLPPPPAGRTIVVGAGKAAAAMAQAVEEHWEGPLSGLVVTRYGHSLPCRQIEVVEAGHPVSDDAGVEATKRLLGMVAAAGADDLVLCLISGGGSSLLAAPPLGVSLADEQRVMRSLLTCGATIAELNCVRKHISLVKGGRLALAAHPARLVTLVISDVPGDDVSIIASGPTVADPTTSADAIAILAKYDLAVPGPVLSWLSQGASETPKPGDLPAGDVRVIATPQMALEAAAGRARELGYAPLILGSAIEGEAREVARVHGGIARQVRTFGQPVAAPCVLLSGGETTVTVRGAGRGGRNAEFLLSLAIELDGMPGVHALAADTDGIDGTEDNAGAVIGPDILRRISPAFAARCLAQNDGYGFFKRAEALLVTGPTFTNVNDFRAILVDAPESPSEAHSC
jgi:glycerate 2-kinase